MPRLWAATLSMAGASILMAKLCCAEPTMRGQVAVDEVLRTMPKPPPLWRETMSQPGALLLAALVLLVLVAAFMLVRDRQPAEPPQARATTDRTGRLQVAIAEAKAGQRNEPQAQALSSPATPAVAAEIRINAPAFTASSDAFSPEAYARWETPRTPPALRVLRLRIVYIAAKGAATDRVIVVTGIRAYRSNLLTHVDAYCDKRRSRRTFAIDRIVFVQDMTSGLFISHRGNDLARWIEARMP